jgi:MFS transporter, PPP family, 3-phenylpropionic acid transporter
MKAESTPKEPRTVDDPNATVPTRAPAHDPNPRALRFGVYYAVHYMATAVYIVFIPLYLSGLGFSRALVGALLAFGPLAALVAHPVWGLAADRSPTKNRVLFLLILGSAASILLFPVSPAWPWVFFCIVLFSAFQTPITPMNDAIALEHLTRTGGRFGPVRLAGTLGYAVMAVVAGFVARGRIDAIFPLYAGMALLAFLVAVRLPKVAGHQSAGPRVPLRALFRDRGLVVLMSFNFVLNLTLGFYYSFFAIHLKSLGADTTLQGWAIFITSFAEIPFLLFADRILARIGVRWALAAAGGFLALRWLLFSLVGDPVALMAVNALHGVTVIVLIYGMATYVNTNVRPELRASGQALNAMLCIGIARVIGSVAGGWISDLVGVRTVFLGLSALDFAAVAAFVAFLLWRGRLARQRGASASSSAAP